MKYKNLEEVVKQLNSAVVAHGKQAKTIKKHINEMESPAKKYVSDAQRKAIHASKAEQASPVKGVCGVSREGCALVRWEAPSQSWVWGFRGIPAGAGIVRNALRNCTTSSVPM